VAFKPFRGIFPLLQDRLRDRVGYTMDVPIHGGGAAKVFGRVLGNGQPRWRSWDDMRTVCVRQIDG
jgi:hypothetical protein